MKHLDEKYQDILLDLINNGVEKEDRTGTGTLSVFGKQFRHNMADGFPLLTTKKMAWKTMVTELLWFLRGDTNIKWLVENKCNIWNGDAYKSYRTKLKDHYEKGGDVADMSQFLELVKEGGLSEFGDLGPIYGKQWRNWFQYNKHVEPVHVDQIAVLIDQLKTNPDSRRLMVNAWNVADLDQMVLPPCHYGFQCYVSDLSPLEIIDQAKKDGLWKDTIPEGMTLGELQKDFKTKKLSLMWNQRSVDTFLGLPFNIASYGLLLEILAKEVGMIPDQLIGNFGDVHLYSNHIEQAREQITRVPFELSTLVINDEFWNPDASFLSQIEHIQPDDFYIKKYESHARIKAPLSN
jgi:thymidylate synthase|tara:strand:- start:681 stop:1727 length:1047 start_codon:yes stop_codon:yes gene_type:complete